MAVQRVPVNPEGQRSADLHVQFEEIVAAVWDAEKYWRISDRIDYADKDKLDPGLHGDSNRR